MMGIGSTLLQFDTVQSTNKTAADLFNLSKVRHGAVIVAREQTSGRGQHDRTWVSGAGLDLTFSVVLEPKGLRVEDQFVLAKMAALAIADVVRPFVNGAVSIKWPNDILIEREKLAGILIQNELAGEKMRCSIVGIGLNVNSSGLPVEMVATSLLQETGEEHHLPGLLELFCASLEKRWHETTNDPDGLAADYTRALWSRGRWVDMVLDGSPIKARPMDVDRLGRLIVEQEGGDVAAYGLDRLRFAPR
ncbi:MAG: biotin--[acetyl-CoA-carboxylase] ligase [Flavobacteriales bacterium]|nr:biotin--[acetyl-CoA-carboxylase] ligase [Flavobacteriales bacterium]